MDLFWTPEAIADREGARSLSKIGQSCSLVTEACRTSRFGERSEYEAGRLAAVTRR